MHKKDKKDMSTEQSNTKPKLQELSREDIEQVSGGDGGTPPPATSPFKPIVKQWGL